MNRPNAASQILSTVRSRASSFTDQIYIPGLQAILRALSAERTVLWQTGEAEERAGRYHTAEGLLNGNRFDHSGFKYVPPIVEIKASGPAEGRTQFLYLVAAKLLLGNPIEQTLNKKNDVDSQAARRQRHRTQNAGIPGSVIWIDCSCRLNTVRLQEVMLDCASRVSGTAPTENEETSMKALLDNLRVLRPRSSSELLAAVRQLDSYLLELQDQPAGQLPVRGIILSDLSTYYWEDQQLESEEKADADLASRLKTAPKITTSNPISGHLTDVSGSKRKLPFTVASHYSSLASSLLRLSSTFACPLLISTISHFPTLFPKPGQNAPGTTLPPTLRSQIPTPLARHVNVEITLQKEKPKFKFAGNVTIQEALEMRPAQEAESGREEMTKIQGWIDARKWAKACSLEAMDDELFQLATERFTLNIDRKGVGIQLGLE